MKTLVLVVYLSFLSVSFWLKFLNLRYLKEHGQRVPPEFGGAIDAEILRQTTSYTVETSRLGVVASILNNVLVLVFFFGGLIVVYDGWIASFSESFVGRGVLFFLGLMYAETLFGIPFSLFSNFRIESRYGFNTMTGRLWLNDLIKSTVISSVLLVALVAAALFLVHYSPGWWWLWVWGVFLLFSIFLMYISPYVIEPLFFKFEPVRVEGLETEIRSLVEKAGFRVNSVLQVDASRRSRHSNAYFTGIGRVKRIVLFDTLLESMNRQEILAVLAHELGHWKKQHVLKRIIVTEIVALAAIFLAFKLLAWDGTPSLVGLEQASLYARLALLAFLGTLLTYPLTPLLSFLSRRHEREADRFACNLTGRPKDLAGALIKLSKENLSNLHPHPLYASVYYSHPPVVDRVRRLQELQG
ncbi:MAG: M48 family metallopeptidase [Deltaproteobacteria bacterium]|nr:MAG: M48 family metallopeptidase [Deltaproteobacteria bacterium]